MRQKKTKRAHLIGRHEASIDRFDWFLSPRKLKSFFDAKANNRLKKAGISSSQLQFIIGIRRHEGVSLRELSEIVGVDKALTTRAIKKLIVKGFAEAIPTKGRAYNLRLTDKGLEIEAFAKSVINEIQDTLFEYLSEEDKERLAVIMTKIKKKLDEEYRNRFIT